MEFQSVNCFWQTTHGTRCSGLYLFFIKSKSPVEEPSVKLSPGCAYNTVLLSSPLLFGISHEQGPFSQDKAFWGCGEQSLGNRVVMEMWYLLSKVPGKAHCKWCWSSPCPAALGAAQAAASCVFMWNAECQMEETVVSYRASLAGAQAQLAEEHPCCPPPASLPPHSHKLIPNP